METKLSRVRKILVAIDFSSYSRPTLEYAVEVAKTTKSRILVINIINQKEINMVKKIVTSKYPGTFSLEQHLSREMGHRELKLKTLLKGISGLSELPVEIFIGDGVPFLEILKTVDREEADLLVFGPKGGTNINGFLFGSVAEKLFRHSPVPVMSLRFRSELNSSRFSEKTDKVLQKK